MSALAVMLKEKDFQVSGFDERESRTTKLLQENGIFVDFAVLYRIRSARWKMQELDKELDHVMENLRRLAMETDGALAANENAVRRLVTGENP